MKLRVLAAGVLAVAALAGCQSKIGQAAVVNGVRLSDSDVSTYVTKKAVPFATSNGQITPKVFAVESWIEMTLFEQTIDKHGGSPTSAERTEYEGLTLGSTALPQLTKAYTEKGFTTAMRDVRIRTQTDFYILIHRLNPDLDSSQVVQAAQGSQANDAVKAVAAVAKQVSVSRRYGEWDPKTLTLSDSADAGLPSFVTFGSGATADANQ